MRQDKNTDTILLSRLRWRILTRILFYTLFFAGIFRFVLGIETVESDDMYPAVRAGDTAVYLRIFDPKCRDVVLYRARDGVQIGRIAALSGARIDQTGRGELTIDGTLQPVQHDAGIYSRTPLRRNDKLITPSRVPRDSCLILGDDRKHAADSRSRGFISRYNIRGKVFMIVRRRSI